MPGPQVNKPEALLKRYEEILAPLRDQPIRLLELGIYEGGSLIFFRDYLPQARIVGLDINPVSLKDDTSRIHTYQGSQDDTALLDRIAEECAPGGFDVIIDDAAHVGHLARKSFWHLAPKHLKRGGIYVVEDWGTGYWPSWPDGALCPPGEPATLADENRVPSHDHGMVGFVKELIDECGMIDRTAPELGAGPLRVPLIREMRFTTGQVVIWKV